MSDHVAKDAQGQFLRSIVERTRRLVGGDAAALCLLDSRGGRLEVAAGSGRLAARVGARARAHRGLSAAVRDEPDRVMCVNCESICCPFDARRSAHFHVAIPVRVRDDLRGVLCATSVRPAGPSMRCDPLLPALGDLAASCLDGGQVLELAAELGALSVRRQIAADMHDGVAQTMAYLQMQLDRTVDELSDDAGAQGRLIRLRKLFGAANDELRTAIDVLHRPPDGQCELGSVLDAVAHAARAGSAAVSVRVETGCRVPRSVAEQVRLVVQEAVANATQHAAPRHIAILLCRRGRDAVVSVLDDGRGFDPAGPPPEGTHLGLGTMRLRAGAIGGSVEVSSRLGTGTTVTLRWSA